MITRSKCARGKAEWIFCLVSDTGIREVTKPCLVDLLFYIHPSNNLPLGKWRSCNER